MSDGRLAFIGRVDDQVKVRGHRIEPGEIESVLNELEQVSDCAVTLIDEQLVAYVVAATEQPEIEQWREQLRTRLPVYMQPQFIEVRVQSPHKKRFR